MGIYKALVVLHTGNMSVDASETKDKNAYCNRSTWGRYGAAMLFKST